MHKLYLLIVLSVLAFSARSEEAAHGDFTQCLPGLKTLEPFIEVLADEMINDNVNLYMEDLKILFHHFRNVAKDCGVNLPMSRSTGNAVYCNQDVSTLGSLLRKLKAESNKPITEQSLITVITVYMSLAHNLPKTIQDCGLRR